MMSSYEFDQPLDLRLKALNLSLGSYQRHSGMMPGNNISNISSSSTHSCASNGSSSGSSCSISSSGRSSSSSSSTSVGGCCCNGGSCPSINGRGACIKGISTGSSGQLNLAPNSINLPPAVPYIPSGQIQQPTANSHGRMMANPYQQPQQYNLGARSNTNQNQTYFRPANIHCQPLNHHQPHPLSRLHPPPSHIQTQTSNSSSNQQQPIAQTTPPPSHQQPLQQPSPQHHYQQQSSMPPIKSLSLSNHLINSVNFSRSLTPPGSTNQQHHHNQHKLIHDGNMVLNANQMSSASDQLQSQPFGDLSHQQLTKLSPVVRQNNTGNSQYMHQDINTATPFNNSNNPQQTDNQQPDTASPITRQHSLVSRYNCKPCGIVFSQPETLRAHQEGYCTKRDRSQTQVRSQSAVSPSTLQQQQQQQTSPDNK